MPDLLDAHPTSNIEVSTYSGAEILAQKLGNVDKLRISADDVMDVTYTQTYESKCIRRSLVYRLAYNDCLKWESCRLINVYVNVVAWDKQAVIFFNSNAPDSSTAALTLKRCVSGPVIVIKQRKRLL